MAVAAAPSVSDTEAIIMAMLEERGELHGHAIALEGSVPRGSVYVTLRRLVAKGFIRASRRRPSSLRGGVRRRPYHLTERGIAALKARRVAAAAFAKHGGSR